MIPKLWIGYRTVHIHPFSRAGLAFGFGPSAMALNHAAMAAAQARKPIANLAVWALVLLWADQDPDLIALNLNPKHMVEIGVQVGAADIAGSVF
jgi:hypothetical protein